MKIIDAHMHYSHIASFEDCALRTSSVDYSESGYSKESEVSGIVHSVCMGLSECKKAGFPDAGARTPMMADLTSRLPVGISLCPGINPHILAQQSLTDLENLIIRGGLISGIKIYAGYYHVSLSDPVYEPVYKLAEKYGLSVAIHTGDTYSNRGLLKYSHPLLIDELAVAHPDLRIVACHMGAPWVFDACEIAAKNRNVYVDLSGLLVGSAGYIDRMSASTLLVDRYRQALVYLDNYDKVLFGTDWPLAPMGAYIGFCKQLIPHDAYERVFYQNAINVYKLDL